MDEINDLSSRETVRSAVQICGLALKDARFEFKDDEDIVLVAVDQFGDALKYASDRLKDSPLHVLRAVRKDPYPLIFASARLRNDQGFIETAIIAHCHFLESSSKSQAGQMFEDYKDKLEKHRELAVKYYERVIYGIVEDMKDKD